MVVPGGYWSCFDIQVLSVEEEMRDLLEESAREKRNMETKLSQLTTVVHDLHKGFTDSQ